MTAARRRTSIFILAILALQIVPVAREQTGRSETLWPFLAWGMFRHASEPPVEALRLRLYAETPTGERLVTPADAGVDRFMFRRHYQYAITTGDSAAARDLAARVGTRWRVPVSAIVAEKARFLIEEGGLGSGRAERLRTPTPPPRKPASEDGP